MSGPASYWDSRSDCYQYPGSGVLKNIPGIRNARELEAYEQLMTGARVEECVQAIRAMPVDLAMWQAIYRTLFQDIYEWAGELRSVQLAKGSNVFAHPQHIEREGRRLFGQLADEHGLRGLRQEALASRLAYYFAETNVLHPFREGNGRTQFARRTGHAIDWPQIDAERLLKAILEAFERQQYAALERLFRASATPAP
jgi:cell filamentation protein